MLDGHGFTGLDASQSDHVDVDVEGIGTVRARYVVAADGMWSPVRKAVGAGVAGYRGEWHAFRQYVRATSPGLPPIGSSCGSSPICCRGTHGRSRCRATASTSASACSGTASARCATWPSCGRDLLARPHVVEALGATFELEGRHTAWPIPARIDDIALTHGRVLFVGDAAAATDVMTGEGIGQALLTGRLAAEAITAAGALAPDAARAIYEHQVADELFADHRMSKRLGTVLASEPARAERSAWVAASGDWGRRNFARWMFEDEPRAILTTPRRWHRRMLRRPGAYT